jgi:hypothetical protein
LTAAHKATRQVRRFDICGPAIYTPARMSKRTPHGERRHAEADRPTSEAAGDKASAHEIYKDYESGNYVFIGPHGRTHVYTPNGSHHTSFRTTRTNRQLRLNEGKWEQIGRDELPDELK